LPFLTTQPATTSSSRALFLTASETLPAEFKRVISLSSGILGGPGRIRTGDRQVSRGFGYEPAALSSFSVLLNKEVT